MKKIILSAVAVFAFGFVSAQDVKFGVKGGLNLSTIKSTYPGVNGSVQTSPDNKMLVGFHVGGFAEIGLSDKLSFQPELLFSMEGSKAENSTTETENMGGITYTYKETSTSNVVTNYINVPLLLKYKATENLFFVAGPQVGFLMSAKQDYESKSTTTQTMNGNTTTTTDSETLSGVDVKKQFESMSYGLDLGAGYFFTENLFAEVRYNLGLSNNAKPVTENFGGVNFTYEPIFKANTLQVSLGYRF